LVLLLGNLAMASRKTGSQVGFFGSAFPAADAFAVAVFPVEMQVGRKT